MSAAALPFYAWSRSVAPLLLLTTPASAPPPRLASAGEAAAAETRARAEWSQRIFDTYIGSRYQEPQRHYHTLTHVAAMLRELDTFLSSCCEVDRGQRSAGAGGTGEQQTGDATSQGMAQFVAPTTAALQEQLRTLPTSPDATLTEDAILRLVLDLAILFHDAVYDPTAKDNEAQSARLLLDFFRTARAGACSLCPEAGVSAEGRCVLSTTGYVGAGPHDEERRDEEETILHEETAQLVGAADVPPPCPHVGGLWTAPALAAAVAAEVTHMILATAHHFSVPPMRPMTLPSTPADGCSSSSAVSEADYQQGLRVPTELLLLDLDLAVLGGAPDAYTTYAEQIRQEYIHFSDADFYKGRGAFLSSAIGSHARESKVQGEDEPSTAHPAVQLFKTPFFFHRFEAQAWRNMRRELATAEAKLHSLEHRQ